MFRYQVRPRQRKAQGISLTLTLVEGHRLCKPLQLCLATSIVDSSSAGAMLGQHGRPSTSWRTLILIDKNQ